MTTSEMSAQTIKRQAARIEHLMSGDIPRHVRILDNGGTEHPTLNLHTAVHSGRYKGRVRGFAGAGAPSRSMHRVLGTPVVSAATLSRARPCCGLLMMPGHYFPLAILHDLSAAEEVFRHTYREPLKKPQKQKNAEARETFRRNLLGADWGARTPLFTIPVFPAIADDI